MATLPPLTRKPTIAQPRAHDLAALQALARETRERFQSTEAVIEALRTTSNPDTLFQQIQGLLTEVARLRAAVAALQSPGTATTQDASLFLLTPQPIEPVRDDGPSLLWPAQAEQPTAINDASAILAGRVFGA